VRVEDGTTKQPKSVIMHHLDPVLKYQIKMGVTDFNEDYDHFFLMINNFIYTIGHFNVWLKRINRRNLPPNPRTHFKLPPELNKEYVEKMKQIWYGNVFLAQLRGRRSEVLDQRIVYSPKELRAGEEILDINGRGEMPALMHMNPRSKTKDDTDPRVLLQEAIRFDVAYDGFDPDQLAQVFGFKYEYVDGEVYMFNTDAEVMTSEALVIEISREVFHKLIRILIMEILPMYYELTADIEECLSTYSLVNNLMELQSQTGEESYVVDYG